MSEPYDLTVAQAASEIAARRLSAVELMRSLLARSEALEDDLRLWVTLDHHAALTAAEESQRELDASGPRGPLHGVPMGVKDIFHTAGMRTTACSPIYADFVPDADADSVARLRAAGAIVMGKTVTTQFAWADPSPTRNPWNLARTPGGSSSGSAAGVAARAFPFALGSQTGGSVLRPASYNGVVGLKPHVRPHKQAWRFRSGGVARHDGPLCEDRGGRCHCPGYHGWSRSAGLRFVGPARSRLPGGTARTDYGAPHRSDPGLLQGSRNGRGLGPHPGSPTDT